MRSDKGRINQKLLTPMLTIHGLLIGHQHNHSIVVFHMNHSYPDLYILTMSVKGRGATVVDRTLASIKFKFKRNNETWCKYTNKRFHCSEYSRRFTIWLHWRLETVNLSRSECCKCYSGEGRDSSCGTNCSLSESSQFPIWSLLFISSYKAKFVSLIAVIHYYELIEPQSSLWLSQGFSNNFCFEIIPSICHTGPFFKDALWYCFLIYGCLSRWLLWMFIC